MTQPLDKARQLAAERQDDPRLDCEMQILEPSARGLRACRQLQVRTVREFLARDRHDFLAVRNCGDRTYDDLALRVCQLLAADAEQAPTGDDRATPILGLLQNPRAERAFRHLGIATVGEFFATPKDRLLAVPGFGERTYWAVTQRIQKLLGHRGAEGLLLPHALVDFKLRELGAEESLVAALERQGSQTVGDLLETPRTALLALPDVGAAGIAALRDALDRLVRVGTERTRLAHRADPRDFEGLVSEIEAALDPEQRTLFRMRVGLGQAPLGLDAVAGTMGLGNEEAHILEEQTRLALRQRVPLLLARVREDADAQLAAAGGLLHCNRLAHGSLLHAAADTTGDRLLPLRLLRFLFPRDLFLHGELLTPLTARRLQQLRRHVRGVVRQTALPAPLADVLQQIERVFPGAPRGVVLHLLEERERLCVRFEPQTGEMLHPRPHGIAERLAAILAERDEPTALEDLLFLYRDHHGRGNMKQLLHHLRKDKRFLEVGRHLWNLRSAHLQDLADARAEADTIAGILRAQPGRQHVFNLYQNSGVPERKVYMVVECLRQDPRVRYLGEGTFCGREEASTVMLEIKESMRRAMGEIVLSRFIQNQHPRRRRLTVRMLRDNKAFVEPKQDRIDLLTNYPFNDERLDRLVRTIQYHLAEGQGYATARELLAAIRATDLGGDWLTEHMLLDLLRRNSDFELLAGGLVAQPTLGLAGWIQQRARECLRQAPGSLTPQEVLAEVPELAPFAACLEELLERDPMVQCVDGERYAVL